MSKRPIPIAKLRLSAAAQRFLDQRGIESLDELAESIRIRGVHQTQGPVFHEVHNALRALFASCTIDWNIYQRRFVQSEKAIVPLLPARRKPRWSANEFVENLPGAAADVVRLQFSALHAEVLQSRVLPSSAYQSLSEIASAFKLSKARVHKVEQRIVLVLRRALLDEDYRRCRFRFRTGFNYPLRTLAKEFDRRHRGATRMRAETWSGVLHRAWDLQRSDMQRCEGLILKLLRIDLLQPR